ncbi:MAG: GntR family transcriptional regulator, partial [Actinomycetota bacterium]|nr:GntR family transcriptional regulator [Actinomycetota bacterium]
MYHIFTRQAGDVRAPARSGVKVSAPAVKGGTEAKPEVLQEFVLRRLSRDIVSGELLPGARMSPARLADQLGVSHIPVR